MSEKQREDSETLDTKHPLIRQMGEFAAETTGFRMLIVHPESSGWGETYGSAQNQSLPPFCRLIKSVPEGAKHCRMCHILMAVAACSGGLTEQRCHAGARVLVCPASSGAGESLAVLSSCIFSSAKEWDDVRRRGEKLGVDIASLRKAFTDLPQPDEDKLRLLRSAMQTMSYAIQTVRQNTTLGAKLSKLLSKHDPAAFLRNFLELPDWTSASRRRAAGKAGEKPLLIQAVCELVQQRYDLPLTIKELAAAARLTPNHFTTLFHKHVGIPFNEYLTEQRITHAKKLLRNPTLSISKIAACVGYDDAGYFTRRFRQKTALSPRQWRDRRGWLKSKD